jgi:hypothetical protein
MKKLILAFLLSSAATSSLASCDNDTDEPETENTAGSSGSHSGGSGHTGGSSATGGGSGTDATGGQAGGTGGPPQAPVMDSVSPLAGALHVAWTNVTLDCDRIELLKNQDGGDFMVAYTLVGEAEAQHDEDVVPSSTYCYKARCVRGDETSPDSNEECGTP